MAIVQREYSRRSAPPEKKTVWLVVDDPIHSEYDEAFPAVEELKSELMKGIRAILATHRGKSSIRWSDGSPANSVRAGVTAFGKLRIFEEK